MPINRTPSPTKAERTHAKLVDAAVVEICLNGSFSADTIARRAGTSVATFYTHFESKEVALTEAFSRTLDSLVAVVQNAWQVERLLEVGLSELVQTAVEASISFFAEHNWLFRLALAELPNSKLIRKAYKDHEAQALAAYERFVQLGQRAGLVKGSQDDVATIAKAHLILTQGLNNPQLLQQKDQALTIAIARAIEANLAPTD